MNKRKKNLRFQKLVGVIALITSIVYLLIAGTTYASRHDIVPVFFMIPIALFLLFSKKQIIK